MTAFIVLFLVFMLGAFVLELILGVLAAVFKKEKFRLPHFEYNKSGLLVAFFIFLLSLLVFDYVFARVTGEFLLFSDYEPTNINKGNEAEPSWTHFIITLILSTLTTFLTIYAFRRQARKHKGSEQKQ